MRKRSCFQGNRDAARPVNPDAPKHAVNQQQSSVRGHHPQLARTGARWDGLASGAFRMNIHAVIGEIFGKVTATAWARLGECHCHLGQCHRAALKSECRSKVGADRSRQRGAERANWVTLLLLAHSLAGAQEFPSPRGFTGTRGGQGGTILRVTTLAPSGAGSLAQALRQADPRIVVFEVGGVIDLGGETLKITEPFLSVAGQTAPSPGIKLIRGSLVIATHDVILQHLRIRPGEAARAKKRWLGGRWHWHRGRRP
jgi:hypothetical protein